MKAISDNAEMAREIPRLRSVLASKSKRIGQLEHMVRETQESSRKDYERLHSELEQTKQNCIAKLKDKERESKTHPPHHHHHHLHTTTSTPPPSPPPSPPPHYHHHHHLHTTTTITSTPPPSPPPHHLHMHACTCTPTCILSSPPPPSSCVCVSVCGFFKFFKLPHLSRLL